MEQIIDIIMDEKDIRELDKIQNNSEQFKRWKSILLLFIKQSKMNLSLGLTKENIKYATDKFDDFFSTNAILTQYVNGENLDIKYVEQQIEYFYKSLLEELGIKVETKVSENVQNIFDNVDNGNTNEKGKTLTKSNGHSLLENDSKSRGYVGAFLMAALAASIEVSTVAYILFNGM